MVSLVNKAGHWGKVNEKEGVGVVSAAGGVSGTGGGGGGGDGGGRCSCRGVHTKIKHTKRKKYSINNEYGIKSLK